MKFDFCAIKERKTKDDDGPVLEVYPDFRLIRSKDLMVRGKSFYAIWDEEANLWSTDEYDVPRLIDAELWKRTEELRKTFEGRVRPKLLGDFNSGSWLKFRQYINSISDSATQLDESLTFANSEVKKSDFVSKRLPYSLSKGDISAYDEVISTLYEPDERAKIEWAIGAVISGDSKKIQKFEVFYGAPGTGKGTIMNLILKLFQGYYVTFDAKALTASGNAFSTEVFKSNPLIAIQHDGDLSKIEDNTRLNSIVSHEDMTMNEKFKPSYTARINAFLFMGTNKPVKITDAKSGIIRRLIDVQPSGAKLSARKYAALTSQMDFELGAIAQHCLDVYRSMGRDYYSGYTPIEMMLQTDVFFNYIEAHYDLFKSQDGITLIQAHTLWKEWCKESEIEWKMPRYKLREELKNYFGKFEDRALVDGVRVRSWFSEFNADRFKAPVKDEKAFALIMDEEESLLDDELAYMPAQYAGAKETPAKFWTNKKRMMRNPETGQQELMVPPDDLVVNTILEDIDTRKLHYVKPPINHIVIDFDLKDANGEKSAERNLEAASKWPSTYAEYSKSGSGVHLHYNYDGDASELSRLYDDGIEIKVFTGDSSLRRRLSKCNNIPVATISTGLPIKEKKVLNATSVKSERSLREQVDKQMDPTTRSHPGTKPSIDFIHKILDDAFHSGLVYDLSDYKPRLLAYANNSSNNSLYCIKLVMDMKFKSEEVEPNPTVQDAPRDDRLVFFDVEVFPNLFIVCWKYEGSDTIVRMINPTSQAIEELLNLKLVGFNVRRYDNHILWAAMMGATPEELYRISQRIINNERGAYFGEAYNLSYADIYDFAALKKSLKKWQIELNLKHDELGLPWNEPVDPALWDRVVEYCCNDVQSTEDVFNHLRQDFVARQILAELSGLSVNETTQKHTAKIIFEGDRDATDQFVYTDLSKMFPGYEYDFGKSTYRGEVVGEGGYVDAVEGIYEDVVLLDVESMHPTSIKELNLFGKYTDNFWDLVQARLAIKHKDYEAASQMLDGKLAPYLGSEKEAKALSYALKIVINIVYGMTSATFENPFKDKRNKDNIVAKRGALFMIDLKHFLIELGYPSVHIKTDSVKIPGATPEVIQKVIEFGKRYGYNFQHEYTYSKFALVNKAVYVSRYGWAPPGEEDLIGTWSATGAQFAEPFVFKTLFSKEPITFRDLCVEKHVKTALYLDFTQNTEPLAYYPNQDQMVFIGKAGLFCPIKDGRGGGDLRRIKDDKYYAATDSTGYKWLEAEKVKELGLEDDIDMEYFQKKVDEAIDTISKYGDFEAFVSDDETEMQRAAA